MSKATLCLRCRHAANQVRRVFLSSPVVRVVSDGKLQGQEGFPGVFSKMDVLLQSHFASNLEPKFAMSEINSQLRSLGEHKDRLALRALGGPSFF